MILCFLLDNLCVCATAMSQRKVVDKQKSERIERFQKRAVAKELPTFEKLAQEYHYSDYEKLLWLKKEDDYKAVYSSKDANPVKTLDEVLMDYGRKLKIPVPCALTRAQWRKERDDPPKRKSTKKSSTKSS